MISGVMVDTNVLLDIVTDDPRWADWSEAMLRTCSAEGPLFINPLIYSELSAAYGDIQEFEEVVGWLGLTMLALPREGLFLAGKAFLQYRRRGGPRKSILPDFFIGAHAAIAAYPVLTRDPRRYRQAFPTLALIVPEEMA